MSDRAIVEVYGLVKRYGDRRVLDGVDLRLEQGEALGLLGRNGAGKTTLLRILMGLRRPDEGRVRVFQEDPRDLGRAARQRIGYLSESQHVFPWMRVEQLIRFVAGLHTTWDAAYAQDLVRKLDLPLRARVRTLSLGESRRLGLLLAVAHRPDLLVLDEPAGGLDAVVRREFLDTVIELLQQAGKSVLFSSHILSDVERVASRIAILERGRLLFDGPLEQLQESVRGVDLELDPEVEALALPNALRVERRGGGAWSAVLERCDDRAVAALRQRFPGAAIEVRELSLEEIFIAYTGERHE
ncbi:MAG TPA: ABC transporter ATP-binding protein [Myxococcota bacterium]|jgi:ABC-2 type transport system ATP-binding protein|nr:ABC transporter ATP-binding protein [Myxococcota bacterium]